MDLLSVDVHRMLNHPMTTLFPSARNAETRARPSASRGGVQRTHTHIPSPGKGGWGVGGAGCLGGGQTS